MASRDTPQPPSTNNDDWEWISDFVAGWLSGAVSILVCQPVDTILTKWQAVRPVALNMVVAGGTTTTTIPPAPLRHNPDYRDWRGMTRHFLRTAGPRALWRGASPLILAAPWQNALLMGGYGWGTRYYDTTTNNNNDTSSSSSSSSTNGDDMDSSLSRSKQLGAIFVGGFTGGVVQSFLMSPVELIKVVQQCSSEGYAMSSAAYRIVTTRTITSGLNATLLRDGIPHGVWFVAYDISKVTLLSWYHANPTTTATNMERVPVSVSLLSGAIAATVAWGVGYPADLIKTRIQSTTTWRGTSSPAPPHPAGILETAQQLIHEANGSWTKGLYRGFGMKLVRSIPASMIGFTVYESVKEQILLLQQQRPSHQV